MTFAEQMAEFITNVGTVLTGLLEWMGEILTWVMSQPAVMIPLVIFTLISFAVGVLMRVIRG